MSALAILQREFLDRLLGEGDPADARTRVYRQTFLANAQGALAAAYPVVRRLVGEAFFDEAATRYALAVPSTSGDLDERGARFAAFLAGYAPAAMVSCLPDVARLEWALHESARAADAPALDAAMLARVDPGTEGNLRLALHPSVRRIASPHPVLSIWEANQPGRDGTPARSVGAERVCVRRIEGVALPLAVDEAEWRLLEAFAAGATLDHALDALGPSAAERFVPSLLALARAGVFAAAELPVPR